MTLASSGAISASQINVELGRAANAHFSIGGYPERGLAGKPSGAIAFADFYGKQMREPFTGEYCDGWTRWQVGRRVGNGWMMGDPSVVYWGGGTIPVPNGITTHLTFVDYGGWRYHRGNFQYSVNCMGGKCENYYGIYRIKL